MVFQGIFGGGRNNQTPTAPTTPQTPVTPEPGFTPTPYSFTPTGFDAGGASFDFFSAGAGYVTRKQHPSPNVLTLTPISDGVIRADLMIRSLDDGIDTQVAPLFAQAPGSRGLAFSSADSRFPDTLTLLPLEREEATAVFGSSGVPDTRGFHVAYLLEESRRVIVGAGETANTSLYTITGSTFTAQTYDPGTGTPISCLASAVIGGVAQPERLIVGREGAVAEVLSGIDGTPTNDGDMHANTANLWGVIVTPFNASTPGASTLLLYAGNSISALSSTAAINALPTAVLTNIPAGGWALGFFPLTGYPPRAYWMIPFEDDGGSYYRILSTNAEGDDPQYLQMPIDRITDAKHWPDRGGIVATDGSQAVWVTGGENVNARWHVGRPRTGGSVIWARIATVEVVEDRVLFGIENVAQASTGDGVVSAGFEEWQPESNSWHAAALQGAAAGTNDVGAYSRSVRLSPVYHNFDQGVATHEGNLYYYVNDNTSGVFTDYWRWIGLLPSGQNPFYSQGAVNSSPALSYHFETAGLAVSPIDHIAGYEGFPKVAADCWFGGEFPASTDGDATVAIFVASQDKSAMVFTGDPLDSGGTAASPTFTFHEQDRWDKHYAALQDNEDSFDRLQYAVLITRADGTNDEQTSPNALPFRLGFYIFTDGKVRSPAEADPARYGRDEE